MSDLTLQTEMKMYELLCTVDDLMALAATSSGLNVIMHSSSDLQECERKLRELRLDFPAMAAE